jgi:hypothetical protein
MCVRPEQSPHQQRPTQMQCQSNTLLKVPHSMPSCVLSGPNHSNCARHRRTPITAPSTEDGSSSSNTDMYPRSQLYRCPEISSESVRATVQSHSRGPARQPRSNTRDRVGASLQTRQRGKLTCFEVSDAQQKTPVDAEFLFVQAQPSCDSSGM